MTVRSALLVSSLGLATALSLAPAARAGGQLCPITTCCSTSTPGAVEHVTSVLSDSTGADEIPFGSGAPSVVLSVPKFDRATYAALEGVAPAAIELVGVEVQFELEVLEILVQVDSNFGARCAVQWQYTLNAGVAPEPGLGVGPFGLAQPITAGDSFLLPPASGGPPPPWDYEWSLTANGGGAQSARTCQALTAGLAGWEAGPGDATADFDVTSTAGFQFSDSCGNSAESHGNQGRATLRVVYHYCVQQNQPPVCDAGPARTVPCQHGGSVAYLDGTGSFDPDGTPLDFDWSVDCPNAWFDDPHSPTPQLFIDPQGQGCEFTCHVTLRVTDGAQRSSECQTTVTVLDVRQPHVSCPPAVTVECDDLSPLVTGVAYVRDACDPAPVLTWEDEVLIEQDCATALVWRVVRRTWTATDACGNASSCTQDITVRRARRVLDAVPGSCPNLFRTGDCPPPPGEELCVGGPEKPAVLTLLYTGEDCSASDNDQEAGSWGCEGDPAFAPVVHVLATSKLSGANLHTWFEGDVALGETFQVDAGLAGMTWLQANVHVRLYAPTGELLQHAWFHSSCSQPLGIGDQFGANRIVGFVDTLGGTGGGAGSGAGGGGAPTDLVLTLPGAPDFDVTSVDLATLGLGKADCSGAALLPVSSSLGDVTSPELVESCGPCVATGPDGLADLSLVFAWQDVVDFFGLAGLPQGERVELYLTGTTQDGCPFVARDCVFLDTCEPPGGDGESICGSGADGPPEVLTLRYTGAGCAATAHHQEPGAVSCAGDPAGAPVVRVVAWAPVGQQWQWFDGDVTLGETFAVASAAAGQSNLKSKLRLRALEAQGHVLQEVEFHTSCSQPLNVGDVFGAFEVVGFVND